MARQVRAGAGHLRPHGAAPRRPRGGPHQRGRPRRWRPTSGACSPTRARTRATSSFTTTPPTTPGAGTTARSSFSAHRTARGRAQAIVDWDYNAWGGKYPPYDLDDVIPTRIGQELGLPGLLPRDRDGGRLDRRQRPRDPAHHRGLPAQPQPQSAARPRARSRSYLRGYLGVEQDPVAGRRDRRGRHRRPRGRPHPLRGPDDRRDRGRGRSGGRKLRAAPGKPGAAQTDDGPGRPAAHAWSPCRCRARCTTTASGCRPATRTSTSPTAWSCCRPTIPSATSEARATLQTLFPDREVIGIDCTDLVWGLGAFHCVTQQWPESNVSE